MACNPGETQGSTTTAPCSPAYSFGSGVWGKKDNLPDDTTLSITTMCGHHMIPPKFVKYIMRRVEKGKMTPEDGAVELAKYCYCGIFNPVRCAEIIRENVKSKEQSA